MKRHRRIEHYSRLKLKHFTRYWNCKHSGFRYRRRNFYGYEYKFEVWGKNKRYWVALPDAGLPGEMYMKAKLWEFEDLAKRVKDAIYPAVELEKYLESEATGNICYSCIRCIRVSTQANDVPEIECSIFPQVRFAMDECNEYEGW